MKIIAAQLAFFLGFALFLSLGCAPSPDPSGQVSENHDYNLTVISDEVSPPQFYRGDTVSVSNGVKVGIVVSCNRQTVEDRETWVYKVMFQNSTIFYTESNLKLVETFDWNRPARPGIID